MNPFDLERQLAALRPVQPSPALAHNIERRLRRAVPTPSWRLVAAAVALAACVLLVIWAWPTGRRTEVVSPPRPQRPDPALPVLAHYREALDESPEALERLLDRRAAREMTALPDEPPVTSLVSHSRFSD
jgi:hypothetical protein